MRTLCAEEIALVSAGQNYPTSGERGWNNFRNPVKMPQNPLQPGAGEGLGRHVGDIVDNPGTFIGEYFDYNWKEKEAIFHNQMVGVVNRDRNGDGVVTDRERQENWDDFWTKYEPSYGY